MKGGAVIALATLLPLAAIGGVIVYSALPSPADKAEQRLALVKANGTLGEACAAADAVRDEWLKALDRQKYALAQIEASAACTDAGMYGAEMPADANLRDKVRAQVAATEASADAEATHALDEQAAAANEDSSD